LDSFYIIIYTLDAYSAAAKGLRAGREQAGLTVDNVEEAIEAFQHEVFKLSL